jgi:hypothetical protein
MYLERKRNDIDYRIPAGSPGAPEMAQEVASHAFHGRIHVATYPGVVPIKVSVEAYKFESNAKDESIVLGSPSEFPPEGLYVEGLLASIDSVNKRSQADGGGPQGPRSPSAALALAERRDRVRHPGPRVGARGHQGPDRRAGSPKSFAVGGVQSIGHRSHDVPWQVIEPRHI